MTKVASANRNRKTQPETVIKFAKRYGFSPWSVKGWIDAGNLTAECGLIIGRNGEPKIDIVTWEEKFRSRNAD